jgi:hypothetical protein
MVNFELPKPRTACKFIDPENVKQLVEMLQMRLRLYNSKFKVQRSRNI